jgi:hypothetical protein
VTADPRQPRYGRFAVTGGLLGAVASVVLMLGPGHTIDQHRRLLFFLGVVLVGLGGLLGAALAVIIEARARRGEPDLLPDPADLPSRRRERRARRRQADGSDP